MIDSTTRRLIEAMLKSRKINPDTRSELEEYLGDIARGELHPDDARYVAALARRLGFHEASATAEPAAAPETDEVDDEADDTDEEADENFEQRAMAAEAKVRELEDRLAETKEGPSAPAVGQVLAEVRDAFLQIYAPKGLTHEGLSKDVDAERYKDFLERLEAIERKFGAG